MRIAASKFVRAWPSFWACPTGVPYSGTARYAVALELAQEGIANTDSEGLRTEFLELVRKAKELIGIHRIRS